MIKSTGLANPLPIFTTITADLLLRHHYRLGLVITTVDAVNGMSQLDHQPELGKKAAVADRIVVTKTDLASNDDVQVSLRACAASTRFGDGSMRKPRIWRLRCIATNMAAPMIMNAKIDNPRTIRVYATRKFALFLPFSTTPSIGPLSACGFA